MIFAIIGAITVAASVASFVYSYYQQKRADRIAKGLQSSAADTELSTPTTDEGKLLPVIFGTRCISETFLAFFDKLADSGSDHIVKCQLAICYGPITNLLSIMLDDRIIWSSYSWAGDTRFQDGTIQLSNYPFSDGGKFSGNLNFYDGNVNPADTDLQASLGYAMDYPDVCGCFLNGVNIGPVSNMRTMKFKIYRNPYSQYPYSQIVNPGKSFNYRESDVWHRYGDWRIGGFIVYDKTKSTNVLLTYGFMTPLGYPFSEVRFLKSLTDNLDDIFYSKIFDPATINGGGTVQIPRTLMSEIFFFAVKCASNNVQAGWSVKSEDVKDANPAYIILECLSDMKWGMGSFATNATSFQQAAEVLHSEGFGVSVKWEKSSSIEDFVKQILAHIDAILYVDYATNLINIKLMRKDYNELDIPNFDTSIIEEMSSWKCTSSTELVNTVTVTYFDSRKNSSAGVTVYDAALVNLQGITIAQTYDFPGIANSNIALKVAKRELASVANPIIAMSFSIPATYGKSLRVGDVVRVTYPKYSQSPVTVRIQKLDFGDGRKNSVNVTGIQDIYSLPEMQ